MFITIGQVRIYNRRVPSTFLQVKMMLISSLSILLITSPRFATAVRVHNDRENDDQRVRRLPPIPCGGKGEVSDI